MSYSVCSLARRALIAAVGGALVLGTLPVAAADTVDELIDLNLRAWNGEPELLAEVYTPDGVHTATFYDRTREYVGPEQIETVARAAVGIELIGPRIDIPAADGEWRFASFASLGGGTACLIRAVDGLMTRHDCVLAETSTGHEPKVGLAGPEASAQIDEIMERLEDAWGPGTSVERLGEVYTADAVHSARYLNMTRQYVGPEEILDVASFPGVINPIGERVDFEAPEGELAWAGVSDVAGGSVCLFHAVDGMVTHHDCVLPVSG
jgi:hypothetical protein